MSSASKNNIPNGANHLSPNTNHFCSFSFPLWINSPQSNTEFNQFEIKRIELRETLCYSVVKTSLPFLFEPQKGSLLTAPYIPFLHWSKGKVSWDSGHDDLQSERVERRASPAEQCKQRCFLLLRCECRMADCRHPNLLHNRYRWSVGYDWGNALRLFLRVGGHGESHRHESRRSDSRCHWSRGGGMWSRRQSSKLRPTPRGVAEQWIMSRVIVRMSTGRRLTLKAPAMAVATVMITLRTMPHTFFLTSFLHS